MPFQPLGYRFEIRSPMPADQAKAAIRAKKKRWMEVKNGARGWIAGPFICLWSSAFDRNGPMLFGLITEDGMATRVRGRAGSDLNGVLMLLLFVPVMILVILGMSVSEPMPVATLILCGALLVFGIPLTLWIAHKDRRGAAPLVRFLENSLAPGKPRPKYGGPAFTRKLRLDLGGETVKAEATAEAVHEALLDIADHRFVLLNQSDTEFIQSEEGGGGYRIELRAAGRGLMRGYSDRGEAFGFEETLAAFVAFGTRGAMPASIQWKPVRTRS